MGGGKEKPQDENLLFVLPFPEPEDLLERLREKHPYLRTTWVQDSFPDPASKSTPSSLSLDFRDATILVTLFNLPSDPKGDAPNLRWIHLFSAGINGLEKHPIYTDTDITLTTSSGVHGPQISEWVMMTLLIQTHKYSPFYEQQKKHEWNARNEDLTAVRDMAGQRIGILGYGSIGRQAARVAQAMGMEVLAYTATPKETPESKKDHGYVVPGTGDVDGHIPKAWFSGLDRKSLHHFLEQDLDMLLVSVPLTKDTYHFLGAEEFKVLARRHAFVSNVSRGDILDQDAFIEALRNGELRGAAIDVASPEPLPPDNLLWDMKNVTITPHVSGRSSTYADRVFQILDINLDRRERGEKLINVVNRKAGY